MKTPSSCDRVFSCSNTLRKHLRYATTGGFIKHANGQDNKEKVRGMMFQGGVMRLTLSHRHSIFSDRVFRRVFLFRFVSLAKTA